MSENKYLSMYEHVDVVGDGDTLRAQFLDFKSVDHSPVGIGNTDAEAIADLAHMMAAEVERLRAENQKLREENTFLRKYSAESEVSDE